MGAPALLDAQSGAVLARLNALVNWQRNHVDGGGVISDGGLTQGSGANTECNVDLDTTAIGAAYCGGSAFALVGAGTDIDPDAGAQFTWGATSAKEVWLTVVLIEAGTFVIVCGAVAATGLAVKSTDAEIAEFVGAADYVIVGDVLLTRSADTSLTLGTPTYVRRTLDYSTQLAETEAGFRATA